MTPTIHARSEWTRRAPTRTTPLKQGTIGIVDLHWPASKGRIGGDRTRIISALQGWQRMHMDGKGWSDIAYNVGVDLNGDVWVLRGWDVQDGGVAGRSDDVTILAILGDQDQVTDAMKRSIIWAMDEHERRRGRTLRRTYHGALKSTDCPGPALTAWARAGFPAPTTTIQEEDMPLSESDFARIDQIIQSRAGWTGAGAPMIPNLYSGGAEWPATALGALQRRLTVESLGPILATTISAVGAGLDGDAIAAKVRAAVESATTQSAEALLQVAEQMRLTIETAGEQIATEARDRLTAQLRDLEVTLRPEVTA